MITKVNDIELKILGLFTEGYDKDFFIREVERNLSISSRTAMIWLDALEKKGILASKMKGKIKSYSIRKTFLSKQYFLLAEQYKKIIFLENNPLIKEIIEKIDDSLKGMVILFGSYANRTQKEDSDLDLFLVGDYDPKRVRLLVERYGLDINIKTYPLEVFEKRINDDILLKEIFRNHIILKGGEEFLGRIGYGQG